MLEWFKNLRLWIKIVSITLASILVLIIFFFFVNLFINFGLKEYIKSYSKCNYTESRLTPTLVEEGDFNCYTYITDDNLKVVELSDLHIGGGFLSYKRDRKTIKEAITIIQNELPDLVIFNGDTLNPGMFSAGSINNVSTLKTVCYMMDYLETYYTFNFGKTDTHTFSWGSDKRISKVLKKHHSDYLLYQPEITDYGYTNQVIVVKNTQGLYSNLIFTIESNEEKSKNKDLAYRKKNGIIYDEQVSWAKDLITYFSLKNQTTITNLTNMTDDEKNQYKIVKSVVYTHLPLAEYAIAYEDLIHHNFKTTLTSEYISGIWDELVENNDYKSQIHYNGDSSNIEIGKEDKLFEVLSTELQSLQAVFFGGDHLNNGIISYKGVKLCSNYSLDNITIDQIKLYGYHRGCTITSYASNGECQINNKNLYSSKYVVENGSLNEKVKDPYNSFYLPNEDIMDNDN